MLFSVLFYRSVISNKTVLHKTRLHLFTHKIVISANTLTKWINAHNNDRSSRRCSCCCWWWWNEPLLQHQQQQHTIMHTDNLALAHLAVHLCIKAICKLNLKWIITISVAVSSLRAFNLSLPPYCTFCRYGYCLPFYVCTVIHTVLFFPSLVLIRHSYCFCHFAFIDFDFVVILVDVY